MTNEYKIQLLNYVIGGITPTQPNNDEIFLEQESIDRSKWVGYIPSSWNNFKYEGMVAGNELTSNLTVLYGGYVDKSDNSHGIITLVDENFMPVKTIYNYSSGTSLRYIQYMKQAEDGAFYFIDDIAYTDESTAKTSEKRFVMVNNFTIPNTISNDYIVRLRTSYIFGNDYKNFYCKNMFKDPNSSHYIFFGIGVDTDLPVQYAGFRRVRIIGLIINVGTPNEWTMYYDDTDNLTLFGSAIATFQSGEETSNVRFRCICSSVDSNYNNIDCIHKDYTGNVSKNTITAFTYHPIIDDEHYKKQSIFIDYDTVYFVQNNQRWGGITPKYIGLYKYNFTTSTRQTIYEKYLGDDNLCNIEAIYIDRCDTDLYIQYNNNINTENHIANYYFQRLVNDIWNPILIGENQYFIYTQRTMYVKSNFNLLQAYLYPTNFRRTTWFLYLIKEDYNSLNYNGTPYINYNSLISKKGQIYSDNKLVFARNLYERYINNNEIVSTIQVPNNYLNNINLDLKKLISTTNLDICDDENITNKNIYEMLFVNYINTINVIDEDDNIVYNNTASYITTNIDTGTSTNYNNSFLSKAKISYENDDPQIIEIAWEKIDDTHYQTSFALDTTNVPLSIGYISNDETTTYITKQLNLEQNKVYEIKQKLRIE